MTATRVALAVIGAVAMFTAGALTQTVHELLVLLAAGMGGMLLAWGFRP